MIVARVEQGYAIGQRDAIMAHGIEMGAKASSHPLTALGGAFSQVGGPVLALSVIACGFSVYARHNAGAKGGRRCILTRKLKLSLPPSCFS